MNLNETTKNIPILHQFGIRKGIVFSSFWGLSAVVFGDYQTLTCGYSEPLLWIQLVAEGSLSNQRGLGVAITKARRVNVEGSAFQ